MAGIVERDALVGNLLDKIDELEARIRYLEDTHPGLPGEAAGKLAYYRQDGNLGLPGIGADILLGDVPLAWSRACSALLALPGLRGFWPMSSFDENGGARDLSGQGRTLTYNGNPVYSYDQNLVPLIALDGAGDFLSRADEAGLDILGSESYVYSGARGLTIGGWFRPLSLGAAQGLITKGTSGAATSSYEMFIQATTNTVYFRVSDGAAYVTATGPEATQDVWQFCVGRYVPSTEVAVFVNNLKLATSTGVPAALSNSTAALIVGAFAGPVLYYQGYASTCFLCAQWLSDTLLTALYEQTRALFGV